MLAKGRGCRVERRVAIEEGGRWAGLVVRMCWGSWRVGCMVGWCGAASGGVQVVDDGLRKFARVLRC